MIVYTDVNCFTFYIACNQNCVVAVDGIEYLPAVYGLRNIPSIRI